MDQAWTEAADKLDVVLIPGVLMDQALTEAAKKGDVVSLGELVAANPDILYSVTTVGLNTALHLAASNGHDRFVHHVLLYMNSTMGLQLILTENSDGDTPLRLAVRAGHLKVVEHLIRYMAWARENEANLKIPGVLMDEALTEAAKKGDVVSLGELVAADPDILYSVTPDELNTPLHIAASNGHDRFVHHVLLYMNRTMGLELILTQNSDGDTPLHLALREGLEMGEHLIRYMAWASENGANLKEQIIKQNKKGNTLLHEAATHGRYHVAVKLLLEVANEVKLAGRTLEAIIMKNVEEANQVVRLNDVLRVLRNADGHTPLHLAVKADNYEMIVMLIKYDEVMKGQHPRTYPKVLIFTLF